MQRAEKGQEEHTTEINSDIRLHLALQPAQIGPVQNALAHALEQAAEIGPAKVRAALQLGQRVEDAADAVQHDVLRRVDVQLLREVGVDAQELVAVVAGLLRRLLALGLKGREQDLEPLEGGRVLAHPDELDAAETRRRVGSVAHVPDVLEDGGPGRDANASSDQDRDFVIEDVFGGGAVRAIDAELRHLLAVLQRDFVHAHRVNVVVELSLSITCSEGISESTGEVTHLTDVHGDVRIEGAGGDGEWMPLRC